jgi:hypothetical protein
VTSANNFFCFGNGSNTIFAANSTTGNMILGNGSGQVTVKGDLYVTGTIYSSAGGVSETGQDSDEDTVNEIKGQGNQELRLSNEDNADADSSDADSEQIVSSYSSPINKMKDTNINKSNDSINTESFDAIDVRLTAMDQSILGLGNRVTGLDTRLSSLEQAVMAQVVAMEDGFAMSAAIAARPTPNNLGWNFTAGAGNYESSNALAAGFVYVDPNYAVSISFAEASGSSNSMTNIGISYNLSNLFRKQ